MAKNGFLKMEINFKDMSQNSNISNRLICITGVHSVKKVHFLGTRSFQSGSGCHAEGSDKASGVCFPSIPSDIKSAEKISDGPSENNDFNCTNLAGTALVPRIAEVIKAITISDFWKKDLVKSLLNQAHPLVQSKTLN